MKNTDFGGFAVCEAVRGGDRAAVAAFDEYIANLGDGIVSLCNLLRPQKIVLGGGLSAAGKLLTEPLYRYVCERLFIGPDSAPFRIVCAELGNTAGILGAAAYAAQTYRLDI